MTIDRISYQRVYPIGLYQTERIGLEASLDESDSPEFVLAELKKLSDDLHKSSNSGVSYIPETVMFEQKINDIPKDRRVQIMINDMNTVTDLKVLETYQFLCKSYPEIKDAYEAKLKELQI